MLKTCYLKTAFLSVFALISCNQGSNEESGTVVVDQQDQANNQVADNTDQNQAENEDTSLPIIVVTTAGEDFTNEDAVEVMEEAFLGIETYSEGPEEEGLALAKWGSSLFNKFRRNKKTVAPAPSVTRKPPSEIPTAEVTPIPTTRTATATPSPIPGRPQTEWKPAERFTDTSLTGTKTTTPRGVEIEAFSANRISNKPFFLLKRPEDSSFVPVRMLRDESQVVNGNLAYNKDVLDGWAAALPVSRSGATAPAIVSFPRGTRYSGYPLDDVMNGNVDHIVRDSFGRAFQIEKLSDRSIVLYPARI